MKPNKKSFFQRSSHPYYFRVSEFVHKYAGVRALHYLCHALNEQGYEAWLTDLTPAQCSPWLRTPVLTPEIRAQHEKQGLAPIAVYPESIDGNLLGAPVIARWLLVKPGHDGVVTTYQPDELTFYWEPVYVPPGMAADRLQIPIIDRRIFNAEGALAERKGFCYYAHKYILNYSKTLPGVLNDGICLCQWIPRTPEEIAEILRTTEVLYCYEPSSLSSEALACGCRVAYVDTPYLERCGLQTDARIKEEDIGKVEIPKTDTAHVQAFFDNIENAAWQEIDNFIEKTQAAANAHAKASAAQQQTPEFRLQQAIASFQADDLASAANAFSALLDELPDDPLPAAYLAFICARQGLADEANSCVAQALAIAPERADICAVLGETLLQAGQSAAAIPHLERAITHQPDLFSAYPALARALALNGQQEAAFQLLESTASIPSDAQAAILGLLLEWRTFQGNVDAIVNICQRQRANPAYQALAVALLPQTGKTPEQTAAIVDSYVQQHLPPAAARTTTAAPAAGNGPIRIAFLVSNIRREAASGRLENLLLKLPPARFRTVVLYNDPAGAGSELAQRCRPGNSLALDIAQLDDAAALRLLGEQKAEVLVDLDGLGLDHRLSLFQRAAVAHKFSWSDSALPLAAGIPCLHGAALWPDGEAPAHLALLPGLGEILDLPDMPALPRPADHPFTLACLCAPVHYGSASWRAFARLLASVHVRQPAARLLVNLGELGAEAQAFITGLFAQEGIAAGHLDFIHATDRETLAAAWNQADLGLAPLHGPGDHALPLGLWLNKPWLALAGDAPWSRRPTAWLRALGLDACIAATPDDLPGLAAAFATNAPPLPDALNHPLRQRIRQQGIGDPQATVAAFAALIERHCRPEAPPVLALPQDSGECRTEPPFFSVIIPTHQRAGLLQRTLASLRAQTAPVACEIIVISDFPDAATDQVCHTLLAPQDTYLRRNGPPGPSASRNLGLSLARGRYVLFLDDDDAWHPDFLAQLYARPEIQQGLSVYFDATRTLEKRLPDGPLALADATFDPGGPLTEQVYVMNQVPICNHAFPRHLLTGLAFDPHMRAYEDWDFCLAAYRRQWPTHVPVLGPMIFVVRDESSDRRSNAARAKGIEAFLDYLYVYRRHPAPSEALRLQRSMFLDRQTGIPIPMESL